MKKIAFLLTILLWQIAFSQINVTITGEQSPEIGVSYQYQIQAPAPCNVAKLVNSTLKIAPNPNDGEFTVIFEKEISGKYIIYDSIGTVVTQGNIVTSKAEKINIGKQKQGNYFIKVLTDSQEEFQQIIILK